MNIQAQIERLRRLNFSEATIEEHMHEWLDQADRIITCPICNSAFAFKQTHQYQRYCGDRCRRKAQYQRDRAKRTATLQTL